MGICATKSVKSKRSPNTHDITRTISILPGKTNLHLTNNHNNGNTSDKNKTKSFVLLNPLIMKTVTIGGKKHVHQHNNTQHGLSMSSPTQPLPLSSPPPPELLHQHTTVSNIEDNNNNDGGIIVLPTSSPSSVPIHGNHLPSSLTMISPSCPTCSDLNCHDITDELCNHLNIQQHKLKYLQQTPLFEYHLSESQLIHLSTYFDVVHITEDVVFFEQSQPLNAMYIIVEGQVEIEMYTEPTNANGTSIQPLTSTRTNFRGSIVGTTTTTLNNGNSTHNTPPQSASKRHGFDHSTTLSPVPHTPHHETTINNNNPVVATTGTTPTNHDKLNTSHQTPPTASRTIAKSGSHLLNTIMDHQERHVNLCVKKSGEIFGESLLSYCSMKHNSSIPISTPVYDITATSLTPCICLVLTKEKLTKYLSDYNDMRNIMENIGHYVTDRLENLELFKDVKKEQLKILSNLFKPVALKTVNTFIKNSFFLTSLCFFVFFVWSLCSSGVLMFFFCFLFNRVLFYFVKMILIVKMVIHYMSLVMVV